MESYARIADDVELGQKVQVGCFVNLYGCRVGDNTKIGAFVEIQRDARVGMNCKISSHSFICSGVSIGNRCFIGHGVVFVNDNHPRAVNDRGELETPADWTGRYVETVIEDNVNIGSNATILGGITIGRGATIGAGSVVTKSVPPGEVWVGNPARKMATPTTRNQ